jgi:hypothetical protein
MPERFRATLQEAAPAVRRNQELIRLRDDLPCPFRVEDFQVQGADEERLVALFQRWGFRRLFEEAQARAGKADGMLPGLA